MIRLSAPTLALVLGLATFSLAAGNGLASAQVPPAAPPAAAASASKHRNLQVLPQDISREQLGATMKNFAQALGVKCAFCHVGEEGKPLSTYDFASDAKKEKRIARAMLRMTMALNRETLPSIPDLKDAKVSCFTCHRGAEKPLVAPAPVTTPPAAG